MVNKIMKYGFPVAMGCNVLGEIVNIVTGNILLGTNQLLLSLFMFLYYSEIKDNLN